MLRALLLWGLLMPLVAVGDQSQIVNLSDGLYKLSEPVYLRVMPVGDSIGVGVINNTEDGTQGGWRQPFTQQAASRGYRVDMVGPYSAGPATFREKQHAAMSGKQLGWAADNIEAWIDTHDPDVIPINLGTNNILQPLNHDGSPKTDSDREGTPDELDDLLDQIHAHNSRVYTLVFTVPPIDATPSVYPGMDAWQVTVNQGYRAVLAAQQAAGRRVRLVELHPTMTYAMISDHVHPNAIGYALMGERLAAAMDEVVTTWAGSNRTAVSVTAAAGSSGVLNVTVTAGHGNVESVTLESVQNATVTFPTGGASATWPRRYVPGSPASSVSLSLTRVTSGQDVSARLVVVDDRGPWPALVGAGPEGI